MAFAVIPLQHIGAEIRDLDLSAPIPDAVGAELYQTWLKYGVLVFRGLGTDSERQVRLAKLFGPLQIHPVPAIRLKEDPHLILLATDADGTPVQYVNGEALRGFIYWHSDMAYVPDINKGSVLRMIEMPERGGDTAWTDTALAYDGLSDAMKARIENLCTIQTIRAVVPHPWGQPDMTLRTAEEYDIPEIPPMPPVLQPMVITHPESGIRSLLLSPLGYVRIEGMEQAESDALFEELCRHALQPEYRYVHHWQPDDLVLWDNRRTMHCALGYPVGLRRQVQRATLAEVQPTGRPYAGEAV